MQIAGQLYTFNCGHFGIFPEKYGTGNAFAVWNKSSKYLRGGLWKCGACNRRRNEVLSKEQKKLNRNKTNLKLRLEVMKHYCGGEPHCQCLGCNVVALEFLQLDHIDSKDTTLKFRTKTLNWSDGRKRSRTMGGGNFYRWLRTKKYPKGMQVLCSNCNHAKGSGVQCPLYGTSHCRHICSPHA